MKKHKIHLKEMEKKFPPKFPGKKPLPEGWKNGARGWYIEKPAGPGLYTMDIEHVPEKVVSLHNDPQSRESVGSRYRKEICIHHCPYCFNEDNAVYGKMQGKEKKPNRILTLHETMKVIDDAVRIAEAEGHRFESVKFLGPGELMINPDLFKIIREYAKRGINLNIFTKGAVLGDDKLAERFFGHEGIKSAKDLVERLAESKNVGILLSFQSFVPGVIDRMVTSRKKDGGTGGLQGFAEIRDRAFANLLDSAFYEDGTTRRVCLINAPIVPENIEESFDIYRFAVEHGTPAVMTPTMVSGKGKCQLEQQVEEFGDGWFAKVIELYSDIYVYNVLKGIQTAEQIEFEGIASYVGAQPCNQIPLGLYLRANGIVQMCPGRFDRETVYGSVFETPIAEIWEKSPNRKLGKTKPHSMVNCRCPAKDARKPEENEKRAFPVGFYERVMQLFRDKLKKALG